MWGEGEFIVPFFYLTKIIITMKRTLLIITQVCIVIAILLYSIDLINKRAQREIDIKTKTENELKASNIFLEQRLGASERERMVLVLRADSLNNRAEALVRVNSKLDSLLSKVKGRYDSRSVSQLENEMIKRYNASR